MVSQFYDRLDIVVYPQVAYPLLLIIRVRGVRKACSRVLEEEYEGFLARSQRGGNPTTDAL